MKKVVCLFICLFGGALFGGAANAGLISVSEAFSPVLVVDGSSSSTNLTFTESGSITDVNVFINFTKCDDPLLSDGTCSGGGFSFNDEIAFSLVSATGTVVDLVLQNTYSGSLPGAQIGVLFDDDAASAVGASFTSGIFSPVGLLSDFNGENLTGNWTLNFSDSIEVDPLSVNGWRLDVTVASVPEPTSLALLGLGLAGMGFLRKRKTA